MTAYAKHEDEGKRRGSGNPNEKLKMKNEKWKMD